jgi:hypothetical protein
LGKYKLEKNKFIRLPEDQETGYQIIRRSEKRRQDKTRFSHPDALMF